MRNDPLLSHLLSIVANDDLRQSVYEHVGEYCHQCRNQLNSLKLCLYLARRQTPPPMRSGLDQLEQRYSALERSIEMIQILCRPLQLVLTTLPFELLIDDRSGQWSQVAAAHEVEFTCRGPGPSAPVVFDPERIGQALDSLVQWRIGRLPRDSSVRLTWSVSADRITLVWHEEPPRGTAFAAPVEGEDVWSLPTIQRIVEAHQGAVILRSGSSAEVEISWPVRIG